MLEPLFGADFTHYVHRHLVQFRRINLHLFYDLLYKC